MNVSAKKVPIQMVQCSAVQCKTKGAHVQLLQYLFQLLGRVRKPLTGLFTW